MKNLLLILTVFALSSCYSNEEPEIKVNEYSFKAYCDECIVIYNGEEFNLLNESLEINNQKSPNSLTSFTIKDIYGFASANLIMNDEELYYNSGEFSGKREDRLFYREYN